jgi:hypothetical protein
VAGTDIDGQAWSNPPSIGCHQWLAAPVIAGQPTWQVGLPFRGLTFNVLVVGQDPFAYFWSKDGLVLTDNGHYSNTTKSNLTVNGFGPDDAGLYQLVVSNSFGMVTSQVKQLVIHAVDVNSSNPAAPYSTWGTAATNIQDAVNAASLGDVVLVADGVYSAGGKVIAGDLTNRVALDRPVTVVSVNGYANAVIQGQWDPASANGPGAVRCAWVGDGAVLNGFTLRKGATRGTGITTVQSGGGACCASTKGTVSNCVLTNNSAVYGGGISYGTLNNSLVVSNAASYGGGAYRANLNNCTVVYNHIVQSVSRGAGTYDGITRNCIVLGNYDGAPLYNYDEFIPTGTWDNYQISGGTVQYSNCCTYPIASGGSNFFVNVEFLDSFHVVAGSPCSGTGNASYASGTDLDGEAWLTPPSVGCDEVILSNLVGPLSVSATASPTNLLVTRLGHVSGTIIGQASCAAWSFGDGSTITNTGAFISHSWTNAGDYMVTFTAFNNDNPAGVSATTVVHVQALSVPQLQAPEFSTNAFRFQFMGQQGANYTVQYATNLVPPVAWKTLKILFSSPGGVQQIADPGATNGACFYRVLAN